MGPPGVGKGTQAQLLREHLKVPHVSTGDILREAVQAGTALGRRVKPYLEGGGLVPDDLMGELIEERLQKEDARGGFILDGFPRTLPQVAILDQVLGRLGVTLDRVFVLMVPEQEVVRRLSGRRLCPNCRAVYHLDNRPPRAAGVCDACGSALVQRADDREEVVLRRLHVYREQTLPVLEACRTRGLAAEVDASGEVQDVFADLKRGLAA